MTTLIEFLEARLAEDEATALAVEDNSAPWNGQWKNDEGHAIRTENGWVLTYAREGRPFAPGFLDHVVRHDPARVLREVEAKQAILAEHPIRPADEPGDYSFGCERCYFNRDEGVYGSGYCRTLKALAAVFSDHPDFRKEWAASAE